MNWAWLVSGKEIAACHNSKDCGGGGGDSYGDSMVIAVVLFLRYIWGVTWRNLTILVYVEQVGHGLYDCRYR